MTTSILLRIGTTKCIIASILNLSRVSFQKNKKSGKTYRLFEAEEYGKIEKVTKSYKGCDCLKTKIAAAIIAAVLALSPAVSAAPTLSLTIDGAVVGSNAMISLRNNTAYVSLRTVSSLLDNSCIIIWENGTAKIISETIVLTAREGDQFLTVNNTRISIPQEVKNEGGHILVPLRSLAQVFDAFVFWNPVAKQASIMRDLKEDYSNDDIYWLSRIISAESRGEPLEGKIAVGNVVLNRVKSSDFPNTIYGVIFDSRWGGQFEPVRNGTIYQTPTEESVLAAKLCLSGANVIGDSIYFLAPALAQNFWIVENREYIATIGCHDFYR